MKELVEKIMQNMNISKLISMLFLIYIIYVGLAEIPLLIENTRSALDEKIPIEEYIEKIDSQYEDMLDTSLEYRFLQNKSTYIDFNGFMSNLIKQPLVNQRVKLSNGHLSTYGTVKDTTELAYNSLSELCSKQKQKGGEFLFVIAPFQISKYNDSLLPIGYEDCANDNADVLIDLLRKKKVPVLDLREKMNEQGIDHTEAFYKTDHHWKPQTGFWAYSEILNTLSDMNTLEPIDTFYTDIDNFEILYFDNCFLGSNGRRTGRYFAGIDDFQLIMPKFETNISITIPSKEVNMHGSYNETAYRYSTIEMKSMLEHPDHYNENPYSLYGHGDNAITFWRNESAVEDKRFLMIGDSFGNVPFSFLPLYIKSCDELDMRHYKGDFESYYEEYNPDVVVVLVNVANISGLNTVYDFFPEETN